MMELVAMQPGLHLNLGCGARVVDGWVNVDYALGARLCKLPGFRAINGRLRLFDLQWDDRIVLHDLTRPFPWRDGSAAAIYSSHTLEHLSREQGRDFVRQCHRVLGPGGLLRIVVPDLRHVIDRYVSGELPADRVVEELGVLYEQRSRGLKSRLAPLLQYPHKCMYDLPALQRLLTDAGFEARARAPFDSDIPTIRAIEIAGRTKAAVIVEGRKSPVGQVG